MFANKPLFIFGAFFSLLLVIPQVISYFVYNVLNKKVIFSKGKLVKSEAILISSSLTKIIIRLKFLLVSMRKNYIVVTNKRVILAANFFSFWSYEFSKSFWFGKDFTNARLGKKSKSILFDWGNKTVEIFVDDPLHVLKNIEN